MILLAGVRGSGPWAGFARPFVNLPGETCVEAFPGGAGRRTRGEASAPDPNRLGCPYALHYAPSRPTGRCYLFRRPAATPLTHRSSLLRVARGFRGPVCTACCAQRVRHRVRIWKLFFAGGDARVA